VPLAGDLAAASASPLEAASASVAASVAPEPGSTSIPSPTVGTRSQPSGCFLPPARSLNCVISGKVRPIGLRGSYRGFGLYRVSLTKNVVALERQSRKNGRSVWVVWAA